MDHPENAAETNPDLEFVLGLRPCVARYMEAIDNWEKAYRKFFRLARPQHQVSPDLEQEQSCYLQARQELQAHIPRARRLCQRFDLRDPWPGLLRIELGTHAPQVRAASAFGRSERIAVENCLNQLVEHCARWEEQPVEDSSEERPEESRKSWLGWLKDLIYP
jgi:hypothetical protein